MKVSKEFPVSRNFEFRSHITSNALLKWYPVSHSALSCKTLALARNIFEGNILDYSITGPHNLRSDLHL